MTLELNGIDVDCVIGDRDDERNRLQRLRVDIRLELDGRAAETDDLADTVDYAALTERVRAALVDARCRLVERAAHTVCDVCLADARVSSARVRVEKSGSVPHLASAAVTLAETRRKCK